MVGKNHLFKNFLPPNQLNLRSRLADEACEEICHAGTTLLEGCGIKSCIFRLKSTTLEHIGAPPRPFFLRSLRLFKLSKHITIVIVYTQLEIHPKGGFLVD